MSFGAAHEAGVRRLPSTIVLAESSDWQGSKGKNPMAELSGAVILVTGAAMGLGEAIAYGADVTSFADMERVCAEVVNALSTCGKSRVLDEGNQVR
jgi:hypothetical protein